MAPETIRNTGTSQLKSRFPKLRQTKGHGNAVDWWAVGILVYEFLVGQPPFWDQNPMKLYELVCKGSISYPSTMSADAKDIVGKLCCLDPARRLGNMKGGSADVKGHAWFKNIDFNKLYRREMQGPIIPKLKGIVRHPLSVALVYRYEIRSTRILMSS